MRDKYNLNTLPPGHEEEYGNLGKFLAAFLGHNFQPEISLTQLTLEVQFLFQAMLLWREWLEAGVLSNLVSPFQVWFP